MAGFFCRQNIPVGCSGERRVATGKYIIIVCIMLGLRRLAVASSSSSKALLSAAIKPTYRGFSSTLDDKKKGNEAAYIKAQEAKRMAEAQAKFEALMKSENSEERAELIEMLGK